MDDIEGPSNLRVYSSCLGCGVLLLAGGYGVLWIVSEQEWLFLPMVIGIPAGFYFLAGFLGGGEGSGGVETGLWIAAFWVIPWLLVLLFG